MNLSELNNELKEIIRIFLSAKYYELDFKYLNSIKFKHPIVYRTYYFFIERIFHSVSVALILDLCKLFDKREKYSLMKLKNKMNENYEKSELNIKLKRNDFLETFENIEGENIDNLLMKLKTTRDEYYAHFDRTRTEYSKIQINSNDTSKLISIAENILKNIELKYFGKSTDFDLSIGELGHKVFERLDDWEEYRKKFGLLKMIK